MGFHFQYVWLTFIFSSIVHSCGVLGFLML